MKAAWVFPQNRQCGISIYAKNYIEALSSHLELIRIDPSSWFSNREKFISELHSADLIHIQYETSFFLKGNIDFYGEILKKINRPVLVSLHEVYREFPGVFPREEIVAPHWLLPLKYLIYDLKHPAQSAFRKHLSNKFGADCILVHHEYHRDILFDKGICAGLVKVLPLPVKCSVSCPSFSWTPGKQLHLGSTGFLNPQYDYDLLISVLEKLDIEWKFTWIGGIRSGEHEYLHKKLDSANKQKPLAGQV